MLEVGTGDENRRKIMNEGKKNVTNNVRSLKKIT